MRPAEPALPIRHALALGLLQGPAELLPISSSAHTALMPLLCGWPYARLDAELRKSFEVALHAGAGAALALLMRREAIAPALGADRRRAAVLALALAPPALAGYGLRRQIERRLGGPRSIATALIAGALAMALADAGRARGGRAGEDARPLDGLALGMAQALALIPGVSRSGAALAAARARGFGRSGAHALCWSAGLPLILGTGALELSRLARAGVPRGLGGAVAAGGLAAFLSTLASGGALRAGDGERLPLLPFALYRVLLGAAVLRRLAQSAQ